MKLKEFLEKHNITQTELAAAIGLSRFYLCCIVAGKQIPSRKLALVIEHITAGEVSATELLFPEQRR